MPKGVKGFFQRLFWSFKSIRNVGLFIFDCTGLIRRKEVLYRSWVKVNFWARPNTADKAELALILSDTEYPKRYFPNKNKPVIIDIGAHIGCFSCYLAHRLAKENPQIYSLEPSRENYSYLVKNKVLNGLNFKCYNFAVSNFNGISYLDVGKNNDEFSLCKDQGSGKLKLQKCRCVTLESFCNKNRIDKIDLLKIDCEGEEYNIIKSSMVFIKDHVRTMFLEVHDGGGQNNLTKTEKLLVKNKLKIRERIFPTVFFIENLNS